MLLILNKNYLYTILLTTVLNGSNIYRLYIGYTYIQSVLPEMIVNLFDMLFTDRMANFNAPMVPFPISLASFMSFLGVVVQN